MVRLFAAMLVVAAPVGVLAAPADGLTRDGRVALAVFAAAVTAWMVTKVDDAYIALGAATVLILAGIIGTDELFAMLGTETIWLLIAAFVLAAGVASSGLAGRAAALLVVAARSLRQLVHLVTAALVVTAFAVPATSGRAALAIPIFTALAGALADRRRVVRALAVLFPTVILLSAVASLIGAGAHLITSQILATATGTGLDFVTWMLLGLPLAIVSSHLAAEVVLVLFTRRGDRRQPLRIPVDAIAATMPTRVRGPFTAAEVLAAATMFLVVLLWCTEPLHGLEPALVALCGALVISLPGWGSTTIDTAVKSVPWALLVFMAATAALGVALVRSGAATWLADGLFAPVSRAPTWVFLAAVVAVSTAAHLVIQSRSARSSVLVPLVISVALMIGVNPALAAFASTAAAGFCHTLPSSAKPVAMFAQIDGVPTYTMRHLLRLSVVLAPLHALLVTVFAIAVWPHLGLPVT